MKKEARKEFLLCLRTAHIEFCGDVIYERLSLVYPSQLFFTFFPLLCISLPEEISLFEIINVRSYFQQLEY